MRSRRQERPSDVNRDSGVTLPEAGVASFFHSSVSPSFSAFSASFTRAIISAVSSLLNLAIGVLLKVS